MAEYVDGFVFPISRDRLVDYQRMAKSVAEVWKEHGALDYREFVGDDMHLAGTRSFADLGDPSENEVIIFGWVVFDSKKSRDLANQRVATDPRVSELVNSSNSGFDPKRMMYGGFQSLV